MKRLTRWMVAKFLPGYILLGTVDIAVIRALLAKYAPGHHLTKSAGKGSRIAKRQAQAEAQKQAIEEYYGDPQAETIGD